jgi:ABC-type uncharacterized transport system involved in gliding motility auxiliary subunit
MHQGKRLQGFLLSAAGLVLLALILVAANFAASEANVRLDCSQDRLNTLSNGTVKMLKGLKAPVTVKFYYSASQAQMPVPLKNYAARVEGLLKEYKRVAGGKLILEALDPKPDSDAEESAAANGVEGQSLPNGDSAYLGLAINCLDQSFAIPFLSPERENFLEYDLSSAISRVSRDGKPVLGLISSLPVSGKQAPMVMMGGPRQQEPPWLFYTELKKDYEIRDLGPVFSEIPDEIKTLLVIHPKNLSDSQLYALDQFVLRGGRLVAFVDPLSVVDAKSAAGGNMFSMPSTSSTLGDKLLGAWGVKFDAEKAVADLKLATKLRGGGGEVQRDASWLSIAAAQLDKKDPATAQLDSLLMVVAGAFSCETPEGLKKSVLISSSDDSCMVSKFVAQMGGDAIAREFKSDKTVKSLAIRLDGKFKSAFPDGDPSAVKDAKKDAKKPEESKGLKASSKDGSVILVGDVDMLYDAFNSRVQNLFGQSYAVPLNDNVSLLLNAIGALSGDDVLLDLRSRGVKKRPFEVVDAMLANAEKSYRERIKSLETELADAQRSISELRKSKGDVSSQKFIMSPEVKASIEKFRKQELETRAQLKEIRKSLRSEIDSLEMKIKWANMALMPALVALVGIAIGVIRKWRAKA